MTEMMMRDVILETIRTEMRRDPNVMMLGEDIVGGMNMERGQVSHLSVSTPASLNCNRVARLPRSCCQS